MIWWQGPSDRDEGDLWGLEPGTVLHKALPLEFKAFFSNKSPGYHESTWQAVEPKQAAVPGCLACGLGRRGQPANASQFWEQGQAMPVKMQRGDFCLVTWSWPI